MVIIRKTSLVAGTNPDVLIPSTYQDSEESWGLPTYAFHREDLHTQLRHLATRVGGSGRRCEVRVKSKVIDYVRSISSFFVFHEYSVDVRVYARFIKCQ